MGEGEVVGGAVELESANDWRAARRANDRSPMVARIWCCGRGLRLKGVPELGRVAPSSVVLIVTAGTSSWIHSFVVFLRYKQIYTIYKFAYTCRNQMYFVFLLLHFLSQ